MSCRRSAVTGATRATAGTEGCEVMPTPTTVRPVYEHPWVVRLCHWTNAIALTVLTLSGLRIFDAFPSFGSKIPEHDLIEAGPQAVTIGGWLGRALKWHLAFIC